MKNPRVLTSALALLLAPVLRAADGSLSFDGAGDFVEVPNFHTLGITDEVTIEFWAKTNTDAIRQSVFMLSQDVSTNRFQTHISTFNGTTYWDFGDIGAGGRISMATPAGEVGSWTHYAVSGSAKDNFMRFYVNGLERDYVGRFNPLGDAVASVMRIGGGTSFFLNGSLDDFRVWNVARSAADIQRDMTGPLTGREAGLRLYFSFDVGVPDIGAYEAGTTSNYNAWIHESLPDTATVGDHAGGVDFDGDGAGNQAEWEARTHPANDQDFLGLTAATFSVAESNVTFTTKLGVQYRLQTSRRPGEGWMSVGPLIDGTGNPVTVPVNAAADATLLYRVAPTTAPMLNSRW